MDSEEEALFRSSPYPAVYYVHSPETRTFHANPIPATLSRYSSSHGSTRSFSDGKKNAEIKNMGEGSHDVYYRDKVEGWRRMLSYSYSSSPWWKFMQISWRFAMSAAVALVVFYLITNPPPPNLSVKISRVGQLELAEGVDATGVSTKMLTCNGSVEVIIENKSKLFGLHIHPPPTLAMSFANLPFAEARGGEVEVGADGVETVRLNVGTRKKPMYGAGRSMQDLLESSNGLPLSVHIKFTTSFHVVLGLIHSKFRHQFHCFVLLNNIYDKKHKTQRFISTCTLSSS